MRKQFALALGLVLIALASQALAAKRMIRKRRRVTRSGSLAGQRFSELSPLWAWTASKSRRWMAQRKP